MDLNIGISAITCCECGFTFAVPSSWERIVKREHKTFWCPSCKTAQSYEGESDAERYKRLLDSERQCCISAREEANHLERRLWGTQGYASKLKKKVASIEEKL